jgi:hypothetical protein
VRAVKKPKADSEEIVARFMAGESIQDLAIDVWCTETGALLLPASLEGMVKKKIEDILRRALERRERSK